jgi:DNA-binding LacI/PurR family transcriptional regulator
LPTIKRVAKLAGVSVGTVSHVITGSVPVTEPLRLKVEAAIRELNYHPNFVARSLKTSKTRTLGIVIPDMTIPFFPQVVRGAEAAARQRGYVLMAVNSGDDCERQKELLSLLRAQRVEGILLVVASAPTPHVQISRILESGIPIVCLDRVPERLRVDSVSVENDEAARLGLEHLLAMGHRRIAIVTGPLSLRNERQRLLGCRQALERAGRVDENLIWEGNLRVEDVAAMCRERFASLDSRPEAVFSTNGPTALGVLRAFRACGLRTPRDIAFATFDELTVDDLFLPSITTIVQPSCEIGFRAAELLLERLDGESVQGPPIAVRLPAVLKVRESSRPRTAGQLPLPSRTHHYETDPHCTHG